MVMRALDTRDLPALRKISNYFFNTNGIYSRLCRYMAYLYRYDYFVTPVIFDSKISEEKIIKNWLQCCNRLDNSNLKQLFGEIALTVIREGCYYGYKLTNKEDSYLQQLPTQYCRSRYKRNGKYAIEFNLKYFDDNFADPIYRTKVLKLFSKDIQKAYIKYKKGELPKDFPEDTAGWYLLDPDMSVKFNLCGSDLPLFVAVIPALMDLDEAQELDKEKMRQQLLRIIVQEMPVDKNGDLVFGVGETKTLHENAVRMLGDAIGVHVLTTFADVSSIDMSDKGNVSSVDQLDKVERTVYNEAGISQMQFNTSTNLALEKSIANDEATMSNLVDQFEVYAEDLLKDYNKQPRKVQYKVEILPTTIYNYKDLAQTYKEQTMIGFSKLLPQVALGQSQLVVMSTAFFENEILDLDQLFVAPQMSSTISAKEAEARSGGRPEKEDDQKEDKTIENEENN